MKNCPYCAGTGKVSNNLKHRVKLIRKEIEALEDVLTGVIDEQGGNRTLEGIYAKLFKNI